MGEEVGRFEGEMVGEELGASVGSRVGPPLGEAVEESVGETVGDWVTMLVGGGLGTSSSFWLFSHLVGSHIGPHTSPKSTLLILVHAAASVMDPPAEV